jgi:mannosyltransferase OCH1-like enzyme
MGRCFVELIERLQRHLATEEFQRLSHVLEQSGPGDEGEIRGLLFKALGYEALRHDTPKAAASPIPRVILQFWDQPQPPEDIAGFIEEWRGVAGFEHRLFDLKMATDFIDAHYGDKERAAFAYCHHPAMRCDFFRLCYLALHGGVYIDADARPKGRPLTEMLAVEAGLLLDHHCTGDKRMISEQELRADDGRTSGWRHYFNNNPIAVRPGHTVIARALERATREILACKARDERCNIHWVTGPDNISIALFSDFEHADETKSIFDFAGIEDWLSYADQIWNVSYRNSNRNWRSGESVD